MTANITFFFVYLAEALTAWQYDSQLFSSRRSLACRLLLFASGYSACFLLFNISLVWLNLIFSFLLHFFLLKFLYACSWKNAYFHAALLTGLMHGSETVGVFFLGKLLGGVALYMSSPAVLAALCVFSRFLYFILMRLCLHISRKFPSDMPDEGPAALLFGSFSFSTIFLMTVTVCSALDNSLTPTTETLMMAGALMLLATDLAICAGYHYSQKTNQDHLELQLMRQKDQAEGEYFKALEEQYQRQRVLLHDLRRHLTAIKEFALENADRQVAEYVSSIEELPVLQRRVRYCGNIMLNVVLSRYKELCEEKGVQFTVDVRDVDIDFLEQNDITALFGNLLENAVEAAQGGNSPYLELTIGAKGNTHSDAKLFITLANSCAEPPLEDGAGGFISQKPDKIRHGVGQKSIHRAVAKYDGTIYQYYDPTAQVFHTSILFLDDIP